MIDNLENILMDQQELFESKKKAMFALSVEKNNQIF